MAPRKTKRKSKSKPRHAESPEEQVSGIQREILARLNGLIFLLADTLPRTTPEPDSSKSKKAKPLGKSEELSVRLAQAGLRPIEIAAFTGRSPNNISRDLSKARKQRRLPRAN